MRILQIVGNSVYGGATYLILRWTQYLLERGCAVDVLSTDEQTIRELRKIHAAGVIDSIRIPREIRAGADIAAFLRLRQLMVRHRYDAVHTYTATPSFVGRVAARTAGVRAIFHHQAGWTVNEFSPFWERIIYPPLENLAALVSTRSICVSYAVAKQAEVFHLAPRRKLVTVPNGIDASPFLRRGSTKAILAAEMGMPADSVFLGTAGRLSVQKDVATLLRALFELGQARPHASFALAIAGEGPERLRLEALARELGVSNRVRFLGFRDDIPAFLSGIDIYVSASLREGLSISLLEAMAAAKAIVATSILPNAELIVPNTTGLLFEPCQPRQLADAVLSYVDSPLLAHRCSAAARKKVLESYSLDRMFEQTWALYQQYTN